MPESNTIETDFLKKLAGIIEDNISDEQFGVSELAAVVGMSRSNLLRKVKKQSNLSVSQFIRQVKMEKAMEMLKDDSYNVSEVCFQLGFSSASYFIKCFREQYGYPPGEIGKRESDVAAVVEENPVERDATPAKSNKSKVVWGLMFLAAVVVAYLIFSLDIFKQNEQNSSSNHELLKKSIAVLPFINDSDDSSNVYIINGLMESILSNLQKIEDLKVISRTSVEKYRNMNKSIPEIADELGVKYILEGSGQKIGDDIMLNVQLIGSGDEHLWAAQYEREARDIFQLQKEVAKDIAGQISVVITPEEEARINKTPTEDLVAYDFFLKGQELYFKGGEKNYLEAITYFNKAIERDAEFAYAYADLAISYFMLDAGRQDKQYIEVINTNADNALLYDPELPQSLISKALYYMNIGEYAMAEPYLEKAVEYNPNSAIALNALSDYYARISPNSGKYLEYALRGLQLDIASQDSALASYSYLHISNAFIQTGFPDEALKYIDHSLDYDPENIYSLYVKAYILWVKHRDLERLLNELKAVLEKDHNRLDVLQEVAKVCYYQRDYARAYEYYKHFLHAKRTYGLEMYAGEDAKIAIVAGQMGYSHAADSLFTAYFNYLEYDQSIYKNLGYTVYFANHEQPKKALEYFERFSEKENIQYWVLLFLEMDPLMDNFKDLPEFEIIMDEVKSNFWDEHEQIKTALEEKELI